MLPSVARLKFELTVALSLLIKFSDYLFLSIGSTNELTIEGGMYQTLRDKLGEHVFSRWGRGLMSPSDAFDDNWWCVRFAGEPWSSLSPEDSLA